MKRENIYSLFKKFFVSGLNLTLCGCKMPPLGTFLLGHSILERFYIYEFSQTNFIKNYYLKTKLPSKSAFCNVDMLLWFSTWEYRFYFSNELKTKRRVCRKGNDISFGISWKLNGGNIEKLVLFYDASYYRMFMYIYEYFPSRV